MIKEILETWIDLLEILVVVAIAGIGIGSFFGFLLWPILLLNALPDGVVFLIIVLNTSFIGSCCIVIEKRINK